MKLYSTPHPPPNASRWALVGYGLALGVASGVCSWLVMSRASALGALAGYLPGALLGVAIFIAGELTRGWPSESMMRAGIVVFFSLLGWRLALWARELGGLLPWMMASVAGAVAVAAGILLAWSHQVRRRRVLVAMTATGVVGGLMFTAAYELRLHFVGRAPGGPLWPLLLICMWQAGLVITAACTLRLTNAEPSP